MTSIDGHGVFRYKLDFYYQQAVLYLVTLLLYAGARGTFVLERLPSLGSDPILYIIIAFATTSITVLILNKIRGRRLIIEPERIVFHQRFHRREVRINDIEWMYIGKERLVKTAGLFQIVVFKMKERRRLFRIRIGRYERQMELLGEMERVAGRVPKGRRPFFNLRTLKQK